MPAIMLAPGEFALEETGVHWRFLCGAIAVFDSEVTRPEQTEHWTRGDGGHVAAVLVQPVCVAALRNPVSDEGGTRRAEGDELMRIDGNVPGVFAPKTGFSGAVLQEVARHPMILAGGGEILDG